MKVTELRVGDVASLGGWPSGSSACSGDTAGMSVPVPAGYLLGFVIMRLYPVFETYRAVLATTRRVLGGALLAMAVSVPAPAGADPMTVCPPNQTTYWNGQPCFPQPCVPPYAPGIPPCGMPPPQIGPNGLPVIG